VCVCVCVSVATRVMGFLTYLIFRGTFSLVTAISRSSSQRRSMVTSRVRHRACCCRRRRSEQVRELPIDAQCPRGAIYRWLWDGCRGANVIRGPVDFITRLDDCLTGHGLLYKLMPADDVYTARQQFFLTSKSNFLKAN